MKFLLEGGKYVVFDTTEAREAGPMILEQHAITYDRSADLRRAQIEVQETIADTKESM